MTDEAFMRRAIELAAARVGLTGDNPAVGCVIVQDGEVVGEAATAPGGRPHAEEQALDMAGERARGATAYVTLEPCAHESARGPACADGLIAAGVARVVAACEDASVMADGHGARRLRAAGVTYDLGVRAAEAAALLAPYQPRRER